MNYEVNVFGCAIKCAATRFSRRRRELIADTQLIQCLTDDLYFGMLIPHRGLHILVAHRQHYGFQVSGLLHHPGSIIVPTAVQNQLFR